MVTLLHFDRPYKHVRHHLLEVPAGEVRIGEPIPLQTVYRSGLLLAANLDGVIITVARTWSDDDVDARKLRAIANSKRFCLICAPRASLGRPS